MRKKTLLSRRGRGICSSSLRWDRPERDDGPVGPLVGQRGIRTAAADWVSLGSPAWVGVWQHVGLPDWWRYRGRRCPCHWTWRCRGRPRRLESWPSRATGQNLHRRWQTWNKNKGEKVKTNCLANFPSSKEKTFSFPIHFCLEKILKLMRRILLRWWKICKEICCKTVLHFFHVGFHFLTVVVYFVRLGMSLFLGTRFPIIF